MTRPLDEPPRFQGEELEEALAGLLEAIDQHGRSDGDGGTGIPASLARVDELMRDLPRDAPAQLRHFLERRSYQKALEFLRPA